MFIDITSTDEIKSSMPAESIKTKVGSLFSALFSSDVPASSSSSVGPQIPELREWPGEACVPNASDFFEETIDDGQHPDKFEANK